MMYGIIYKWTCSITNMSYIGQTVSTLQRRWAGHKQQAARGGSWEFHKAIRAHGSENFIGEILCECQTPLELAEMEQFFISKLDTMWPNGYNMRNGAQYTSNETRLKMRLAKLGTKLSNETKIKMSKSQLGRTSAMLGKHHSEESRAKTSAALIGRKKAPFTKEHCLNIAEGKRGSIPWNKLTTENYEKIKAINEATLDRLHSHIIQMIIEGFSFEEIVKNSGRKCRRTIRKAIFRALEKKQIQELPPGFYKRGPYKYQKENP